MMPAFAFDVTKSTLFTYAFAQSLLLDRLSLRFSLASSSLNVEQLTPIFYCFTLLRRSLHTSILSQTSHMIFLLHFVDVPLLLSELARRHRLVTVAQLGSPRGSWVRRVYSLRAWRSTCSCAREVVHACFLIIESLRPSSLSCIPGLTTTHCRDVCVTRLIMILLILLIVYTRHIEGQTTHLLLWPLEHETATGLTLLNLLLSQVILPMTRLRSR